MATLARRSHSMAAMSGPYVLKRSHSIASLVRFSSMSGLADFGLTRLFAACKAGRQQDVAMVLRHKVRQGVSYRGCVAKALLMALAETIPFEL